MYSSTNLPALEKCHYINGMLPRRGKASISKGCRRNGGVKERKVVKREASELGLAIVTVVCHVVLSGSVSSHIILPH
jgi:hypothetical protein